MLNHTFWLRNPTAAGTKYLLKLFVFALGIKNHLPEGNKQIDHTEDELGLLKYTPLSQHILRCKPHPNYSVVCRWFY